VEEDQKCGSSSRALALQAQSTEFKPQSHQKKKKKEVEECGHKAGDGSSTEMGMAWMGS
jgi:hypothetical protein